MAHVTTSKDGIETRVGLPKLGTLTVEHRKNPSEPKALEIRARDGQDEIISVRLYRREVRDLVGALQAWLDDKALVNQEPAPARFPVRRFKVGLRCRNLLKWVLMYGESADDLPAMVDEVEPFEKWEVRVVVPWPEGSKEPQISQTEIWEADEE
jgi:hypothetical protein